MAHRSDAHLGMLRDYEFEGNVDDIRGANVYGPSDEKLGEIDDVIFDHASGAIRYLVIDTGGWLSSRKFVVPAHRITAYHKNQDDFYADLTKERIEMFPAYDEKALAKRDTWEEYERNYEKSWSESPILHQEGTGNIITPPANEIPAGGGSGKPITSSANLTPERIRDRFEPAKAPFTMNRPMDSPRTSEPAPQANPVTGRLNTFEEHIRNTQGGWRDECEECKRAA
ncbi:MAG: PRC-barrel domain-containing protein [Candidatus Koribacter versatilis]|uniref:PRC-barrel domain-containing protein n=1 Tax=Candidatus Korobacter versatilis TaxID=658062 RepID=A0A932EQX9_9BACT|nr:PRC-barrel domain-containing protein [Candidatus Koribacter versatilis]